MVVQANWRCAVSLFLLAVGRVVCRVHDANAGTIWIAPLLSDDDDIVCAKAE